MMKPITLNSLGKVPDSKKLRLRAVGSESAIYAKNFKSSFARKISYMQILIAVIITMAQISTMCLSRYYTSNERVGTGIFSSVIVTFAAGLTLFASHKPSYCKLHTAMALNIVSILGHVLLLLGAFCDGLPTLSRRLSYTMAQNEKIAKVEQVQVYGNQEYWNWNTERPRYNYRSPYYDYYDSELEPVSLIAINLFLTSLVALGGVLQSITSFTMAIMTARAMCTGRANMEGRFFEMEAVSAPGTNNKEKGQVTNLNLEKRPVVFCGEKRDSSDSSEDVSLSSPPSYDAGFFRSDDNVQKV